MNLEEFVELLPGLLLILCRMSGLFIIAPVLGGGQVPVVVRVGAAVGLTALVAPFVPFAPADVPTSLGPYAAAVAGEITIGFVVGFAASLLFAALQIAGEVIDVQMGFMVANVTDPTTNLTVPLMGQFLYLLAIMAFLAVNGHHWLITCMVDSFRFIPLSGVTLREPFWHQGNAMVSETFAQSLRYGAPTVAALLLSEMSMGVIGRAVPQMNILMLGFSIRIAIGFAVIWFVMASVFDVLLVAMDRNGLYADLIRLIRGMAPAP